MDTGLMVGDCQVTSMGRMAGDSPVIGTVLMEESSTMTTKGPKVNLDLMATGQMGESSVVTSLVLMENLWDQKALVRMEEDCQETNMDLMVDFKDPMAMGQMEID